MNCVDVAVKSIIKHPRFDASAVSDRDMDTNIALVELEAPADLNNYINTVCLLQSDLNREITDLLLTSWLFTDHQREVPHNGGTVYDRVTEIMDSNPLQHATFREDSTIPIHLRQAQESLLAPGAALQWVDDTNGQVFLLGIVTHKDRDGYMVSLMKPDVVEWILSVVGNS